MLVRYQNFSRPWWQWSITALVQSMKRSLHGRWPSSFCLKTAQNGRQVGVSSGGPAADRRSCIVYFLQRQASSNQWQRRFKFYRFRPLPKSFGGKCDWWSDLSPPVCRWKKVHAASDRRRLNGTDIGTDSGAACVNTPVPPLSCLPAITENYSCRVNRL